MWWLIVLATVALASFLLLLIGYMQTRQIGRTTYRYTDAAVPQAFSGFRIAQISDYHDSRFVRHGKPLLDAVRHAEPDLIALTGDLFDRRRQDGCQHAFAFVKEAVRIAPVYFVEGNHERRLSRYPQWRRQLIRLGVMVLENEQVSLYRNGERLCIVGMRQAFDTGTLTRLCDDDAMHLVLSHRCENASQYAKAGKALVLTGHAHGGQIRLFGTGIYAPEQGVLPRFAAGAYGLGDATLYVSRGIGNTIHIPRIFDTPEWNLIILSDGADQGG